MSKSLKARMARFAFVGLASGLVGFALSLEVSAEPVKGIGLGRPATPEEIRAWDIDVRPDGKGLPEGKGDAAKGEAIFAAKCAICHGDFAEGVDRWPVLAGGQGSLKSQNPVKTVGSYWPYLSTAYDYIYRAMPYGNAQSLKPNEIYSLIAYILLMNDVITDPDFELSNKNFTSVRLPNEKNFTEDPRPDTPTVKQGEPCMKDCKSEVEVTMRARVLDVTPTGSEDDQDAGKGAIE
jgi:S-disulfanyl-L-cysteine oxidoreductase SoxD